MKDSKTEILDFWFVESVPAQWFQKSDEFDSAIRERFGAIYEMAKDGFYNSWMQDADGHLALCLTLDQFPRNMFRNSPRAFESDAKALTVSKKAISLGLDQVLVAHKRRFLYLPFEHSENLEDQKRSVELFATMQEDDPLGYDYALRHMKVIEEFGRFPHRNAALGRESTEAEKEYLSKDGSGF
ncbi:MAG: DUF924 domain-containing protein [Micavibrio aeruginosavorus]|uniref:DUF924 domain-containing protein n=1 Tax=Micavibrio aeruginosavorus TaxID=349221 RepID=A0A2W5FQJ4_9BACT|nr:MAG: DUF924 domain-containing protein [Micavibrio aeruginosavorus]